MMEETNNCWPFDNCSFSIHKKFIDILLVMFFYLNYLAYVKIEIKTNNSLVQYFWAKV